MGHVYFIRALAEAGRSDILHRVYSREGTGSYGGILSKGLTSLPETWDAMMDGSQSLNHCMLGHVMEWFYGYVGGIRQKPGSVGWKSILIAPNRGSLTSAEAILQTPRGIVVSAWRQEGDTFRLETEIPEGIEAEAILPSGTVQPLQTGQRTLMETSRQVTLNQRSHKVSSASKATSGFCEDKKIEWDRRATLVLPHFATRRPRRWR